MRKFVIQDACISRKITKICPLVGIKVVENKEPGSKPKRITKGGPSISNLVLIIGMRMLMLFCQLVNAALTAYHILFGIMDKVDREQTEQNLRYLLDNQ